MKTVLAVLGVIALILVGGYFLLGPRGEVVKDKVMKQLDKLIGETEIAKKEISSDITKIKAGITKLNEGKIKAQVEADDLDKKIKDRTDRQNEVKESLAKLDKHISTASSPEAKIKLGDKEYTQKDLLGMVKKLVDTHKELGLEVDNLKKNQEMYRKTATTLEERADQAKKKLAALQQQMTEVDAKLTEIRSMKENSALVAENDTTVSERFTKLQSKVEGLNKELEKQRKVESAKWDQLTKVDDVTKIVEATKDHQDTLEEMRKILGKPAGSN